MSNFFRKDLNLGKKWWHRFLVVIFFLGLVISVIKVFTSTLIHPSYVIGKQVATLNSRLTSDLVIASNLVKPWEIAGNSSFIPTTYGEASFWDNWSSEIYCSKELNKYINNIQKITGVYTLYNTDGIKVSSSKVFSDSLKESNSLCIVIDNFQNWNRGLRPRPMDDYSFYRNSSLENIKYHFSIILSNLSVILVAFLILLIIYYKIILYIIYGRNKKKK